MTITISQRGVEYKYPVVDMHAHLRDDVKYHTSIASKSGIDFIVSMPNVTPCLDNVEAIREYTRRQTIETTCKFAPTSAITVGREGKKLVDVETIAPYVIGFTDDGNCLTDLGLLKDILGMDVWVMLHSGEDDPHDIWPRDTTEPEWVERYLDVNSDVQGKLYLQHLSRKESVDLVYQAKRDRIPVTAETCPHYFKWTRDSMRVPVNPPIGSREDRDAIREGLSDGTIDIIASDYAPEPRPKTTGIADWENYLNSCRGLLDDGMVTEEQLRSLLYEKPLEILRTSSGYSCRNINIDPVLDPVINF